MYFHMKMKEEVVVEILVHTDVLNVKHRSTMTQLFSIIQNLSITGNIYQQISAFKIV